MHIPPPQERIKECFILILEDDRLYIDLFREHLSKAGYKNLAFAANGAEGIKMAQQKKPDLVLLDIIMPIMDGYEFIERFRKIEGCENIPIIFQTVLSEVHNKLRAFDLGATDYVAKPLNQHELLARIHVHLINKILIEDLTAHYLKMQEELKAAREMQDRLQPSSEEIANAEKRYGLQIAEHFETSSMLGGDCWSMRPISANKLAITIFDLSGHGLSAALNVFRMHAIMQDLLGYADNPGQFLTHLNKAACNLFGASEFATMFYGVIDVEANSLQYSAAASPQPMVFSKTQPQPLLLNNRGFPLGITADATYETLSVPFLKNDALLLYSDCLIETPSDIGQMMDEAMIIKHISEALQAPNQQAVAHNALNHLLQTFRSHNQNPIIDDLTINIYYRN